jgi:hypothetical protein
MSDKIILERGPVVIVRTVPLALKLKSLPFNHRVNFFVRVFLVWNVTLFDVVEIYCRLEETLRFILHGIKVT